MITMILLSIVTIVRNDRNGFNRTACSISAQTFKNFEWIVVDGTRSGELGIDENDLKCATQYIKGPDRGISDAFNIGANSSKGRYVLFLNSGDSLYQPNTLSTVFEKFCDSTSHSIYTGRAILDNNGKVGDVIKPRIADLCFKNSICHQASFIPRALLEYYKFDTRLKIAMDFDLWLRMLSDGVQFVELRDIVCKYSLGGVSSRQDWRIRSVSMHQIVLWINQAGEVTERDLISLSIKLFKIRAKIWTQAAVGARAWTALKTILGRGKY